MEKISIAKYINDDKTILDLSSLKIQGNIDYLFEEINELKELKELNLSNAKIKTLPLDFDKLKNLEFIKLSNTKIKHLPNGIWSLTNLDTLNVSNTKIKSINNNIGNLVNLKILNLSNTKIRKLPASISNLTKLMVLNISNTKIKTFDNIENLTKLESLNISNTKIKYIPDGLEQLKKLKYLDLSGLRIKILSNKIIQLKNLDRINLSFTKFKEFPSTITNILCLKIIDLSNTKIKYIPNSISNLKNLEELNMQNTKIKQLPSCISDLKKLKILNLSNTKLKELPKDFFNLSNLTDLKLLNTKINCDDNDFSKLNIQNLTLPPRKEEKKKIKEKVKRKRKRNIKINHEIRQKNFKIFISNIISKSKNYYKRLYSNSDGVFNIWQALIISLLLCIIIVLVDILDIFVPLIYNLIKLSIPLFIILVIILFVYVVIKRKILWKSISFIDNLIHVILISSFLLWITYINFTKNSLISNYNLILSNVFLGVFVFNFILILIRIKVVPNIKKFNSYDLFSLLNGNNNEEELLISNGPTSNNAITGFDLDSNIDELVEYLKKIKIKEHWNIGIEGVWGSGKTSYLNIVEEKLKKDAQNNFVLVDKFNPWEYNDSQKMVEGILNCVINEIGIKNGASIRNAIKSYSKIFFEDTKYGLLSSAVENIHIEKNLFNEVNNYLELNNKKMIVIIDDIDRCVDDNVFLIYKLVTSLLKFKNTIYILVYDYAHIKEMFVDHHIDPLFFDKIIQKRIIISQKDIDLVNLFKQIVTKKLFNREIKIEEEEFDFFFSNFKFESVREIVTIINNIDFDYCSNDINNVEFIAIETIKILDSSLFRNLKNNEKNLNLIEENIIRSNRSNPLFDKIISTKDKTKYDRLEDLMELLFRNRRYYKNDICFNKYFKSYIEKKEDENLKLYLDLIDVNSNDFNEFKNKEERLSKKCNTIDFWNTLFNIAITNKDKHLPIIKIVFKILKDKNFSSFYTQHLVDVLAIVILSTDDERILRYIKARTDDNLLIKIGATINDFYDNNDLILDYIVKDRKINVDEYF